jgi:hypothetical protein
MARSHRIRKPEVGSRFPDGFVWGHEWGSLNSKNTSIMQDLRASWLDDSDDVKFGVPNHARLNSLQSAMSLRNFLLRFSSKG